MGTVGPDKKKTPIKTYTHVDYITAYIYLMYVDWLIDISKRTHAMFAHPPSHPRPGAEIVGNERRSKWVLLDVS